MSNHETSSLSTRDDEPKSSTTQARLSEAMAPKPLIAVVGATGYVGGRLVPLLLSAGYRVRAIGRSRIKLQSRPWSTSPLIELTQADVLNKKAFENALQGCDIAYYLVHSMSPETHDFESTDRQAAENFRDAAEKAGLQRIIYLGGLGEDSPVLSKHLRSRAEVGKVLQDSFIPVTVLRAAMIIGSGSASFEILRYLVDRLPVMITPRWVRVACQPIAIRNVLGYLIGCLECPETTGQVFDIGGSDILTYRQLMDIYAEEAHLAKRWIISIPVFTPHLSALWIHLITPICSSLAIPLTEGLKTPVICQNNRIRDLIPQDLISCRKAIRLALDCLRTGKIETHWSDAGKLPSPEEVYPGDPKWSGGLVFTDRKKLCIAATPEAIWPTVIRLGGNTGYYYGNWLWRLRSVLDILFGGCGLRRGRRHPTELRIGDALDFWRVLDVRQETNQCRLHLIAEMKLPGKALLTFDIVTLPPEKVPSPFRQKAKTHPVSQITQTATFVPKGLPGIFYWYLVMPLHYFVFTGMLRGIAVAGGFEESACPVPTSEKPSIPQSTPLTADNSVASKPITPLQ
ncbi:MAG: SDR family oxidoreductase [Vampirovibrionales bacterium]|nr:SDR family oxidoreductase [Vampirovibrionales bacterium]